MMRILVSALILAPFIAVSANADAIGSQDASEKTKTGAPMTAEMIKRSDGSWVIISLSPTNQLESRTTALENHPDLYATFERYRRALAHGDMAKLGSVWIMNPAERREIDRLENDNKRISISITNASLDVEGDRATVSFVQSRKQALVGEPQSRRLSRRGMAAYDAAGAWDNVTTR